MSNTAHTKDASLFTGRNLNEVNDVARDLSMMAGWDKDEPSLWPYPKTNFRAHAWSYLVAHEGLNVAGGLITAEQAERRNFFLVNPHEGSNYATVRSLVCAYQMILPGERARTHRHTPNAGRFVLDVDDDTYTVVDGVRIDMKPGDVLLTPGWSWHGHGNEGNKPGYWFDFLDVPLVHLLEPMFLEWADGLQEIESTTRESPFVISWDESMAGLDATAENNGRHRFVLPTPSLPTMSLTMEALKVGKATPPHKTTASKLCLCASGSGRTTVDGRVLEWSRGDVVAIPSWSEYVHEASSVDTVLFEVSDEPVMERLGFLRQDSA
ncbi:cupin domain-containing protein [Microbacterium sp. A94]|uniref:cupin domain-containing protein n=1 Tax=Microbacterium sp. A94 TaxID=3450717 RepID=UPI003F441686